MLVQALRHCPVVPAHRKNNPGRSRAISAWEISRGRRSQSFRKLCRACSSSESSSRPTRTNVYDGPSVAEGPNSLDFAVAMFFCVTNRVLFKISSVPMREYVVFLALGLTASYVIVFLFIVMTRFAKNLVAEKNLNAIPTRILISMGVLDACGLLLGLKSAYYVPGTFIPVLSQSIILFTVLISRSFLGQIYAFSQLLGVFLVTAGIMTVVLPAAVGGAGLSSIAFPQEVLFGCIGFVISLAFPAASACLKENAFRKHNNADTYALMGFCSLYEVIVIALLGPAIAFGTGMSLGNMTNYMAEGAGCFMGINPVNGVANCAGAPVIPLCYIVANVGMNISLLRLVKKASATTASLTVAASVPLTFFCFQLVPLPLIAPPTSPLGISSVAGILILCLGILLYTNTVNLASLRTFLRLDATSELKGKLS